MNLARRPAADVISSGVGRVQQALDMPKELAAAVRIFYDDDSSFAGSTFLGIESDPNCIEAEDLLAVTLMGEMFPAKAVRQLLFGAERDIASKLLAEIKNDALWDVDIDALHSPGNPVFDLWQLLDDLPYVGATRASKLMARKRPELIPIYDRIIGERIAGPAEYWYVFHAFLTHEQHRRTVEDLRSTAGLEGVALLRVLDTAIWMRYSRGTAAKSVRGQTGLPIDV